MLKTKSEARRRKRRAEQSHRRHARPVPGQLLELCTRAERTRTERRARVEQTGRGERTRGHAEVPHQRRRRAEQNRRNDGKQRSLCQWSEARFGRRAHAATTMAKILGVYACTAIERAATVKRDVTFLAREGGAQLRRCAVETRA